MFTVFYKSERDGGCTQYEPSNIAAVGLHCALIRESTVTTLIWLIY
jgi:hypothetical protein